MRRMEANLDDSSYAQPLEVPAPARPTEVQIAARPSLGSPGGGRLDLTGEPPHVEE